MWHPHPKLLLLLLALIKIVQHSTGRRHGSSLTDKPFCFVTDWSLWSDCKGSNCSTAFQYRSRRILFSGFADGDISHCPHLDEVRLCVPSICNLFSNNRVEHPAKEPLIDPIVPELPHPPPGDRRRIIRSPRPADERPAQNEEPPRFVWEFVLSPGSHTIDNLHFVTPKASHKENRLPDSSNETTDLSNIPIAPEHPFILPTARINTTSLFRIKAVSDPPGKLKAQQRTVPFTAAPKSNSTAFQDLSDNRTVASGPTHAPAPAPPSTRPPGAEVEVVEKIVPPTAKTHPTSVPLIRVLLNGENDSGPKRVFLPSLASSEGSTPTHAPAPAPSTSEPNHSRKTIDKENTDGDNAKHQPVGEGKSGEFFPPTVKTKPTSLPLLKVVSDSPGAKTTETATVPVTTTASAIVTFPTTTLKPSRKSTKATKPPSSGELSSASKESETSQEASQESLNRPKEDVSEEQEKLQRNLPSDRIDEFLLPLGTVPPTSLPLLQIVTARRVDEELPRPTAATFRPQQVASPTSEAVTASPSKLQSQPPKTSIAPVIFPDGSDEGSNEGGRSSEEDSEFGEVPKIDTSRRTSVPSTKSVEVPANTVQFSTPSTNIFVPASSFQTQSTVQASSRQPFTIPIGAFPKDSRSDEQSSQIRSSEESSPSGFGTKPEKVKNGKNKGIKGLERFLLPKVTQASTSLPLFRVVTENTARPSSANIPSVVNVQPIDTSLPATIATLPPQQTASTRGNRRQSTGSPRQNLPDGFAGEGEEAEGDSDERDNDEAESEVDRTGFGKPVQAKGKPRVPSQHGLAVPTVEGPIEQPSISHTTSTSNSTSPRTGSTSAATTSSGIPSSDANSNPPTSTFSGVGSTHAPSRPSTSTRGTQTPFADSSEEVGEDFDSNPADRTNVRPEDRPANGKVRSTAHAFVLPSVTRAVTSLPLLRVVTAEDSNDVRSAVNINPVTVTAGSPPSSTPSTQGSSRVTTGVVVNPTTASVQFTKAKSNVLVSFTDDFSAEFGGDERDESDVDQSSEVRLQKTPQINLPRSQNIARPVPASQFIPPAVAKPKLSDPLFRVEQIVDPDVPSPLVSGIARERVESLDVTRQSSHLSTLATTVKGSTITEQTSTIAPPTVPTTGRASEHKAQGISSSTRATSTGTSQVPAKGVTDKKDRFSLFDPFESHQEASSEENNEEESIDSVKRPATTKKVPAIIPGKSIDSRNQFNLDTSAEAAIVKSFALPNAPESVTSLPLFRIVTIREDEGIFEVPVQRNSVPTVSIPTSSLTSPTTANNQQSASSEVVAASSRPPNAASPPSARPTPTSRSPTTRRTTEEPPRNVTIIDLSEVFPLPSSLSQSHINISSRASTNNSLSISSPLPNGRNVTDDDSGDSSEDNSLGNPESNEDDEEIGEDRQQEPPKEGISPRSRFALPSVTVPPTSLPSFLIVTISDNQLKRQEERRLKSLNQTTILPVSSATVAVQNESSTPSRSSFVRPSPPSATPRQLPSVAFPLGQKETKPKKFSNVKEITTGGGADVIQDGNFSLPNATVAPKSFSVFRIETAKSDQRNTDPFGGVTPETFRHVTFGAIPLKIKELPPTNVTRARIRPEDLPSPPEVTKAPQQQRGSPGLPRAPFSLRGQQPNFVDPGEPDDASEEVNEFEDVAFKPGELNSADRLGALLRRSPSSSSSLSSSSLGSNFSPRQQCDPIRRHECPDKALIQYVMRWARLDKQEECFLYPYPYCGRTLQESESPILLEEECYKLCYSEDERQSLPTIRNLKFKNGFRISKTSAALQSNEVKHKQRS